MIGETVYHYRILDKIGEGGMGVVYRAEDINLRRTVALKFLSSTSVPGGSTRERIMKEARAAASLDHQNICAIHEVEELDDKLFIVMAFCRGQTLGDLIRSERPGLKKTLEILIQIADGLCTAHEAGIIHRDIKPANVIVSDKGKVKITDFGLAKQTGAETKSMTMAGAGTLAYMSPEQVKGEHVDQRTDIWSLGALMYQMITGHRPFEGDYDASVLYNIVNEPHVPAIEAEPGTQPEINAIIERALQKNPEDRYGSMEEMLNELRRVRKYLFGETGFLPRDVRSLPGIHQILGRKLTSILALTVSSVLIFFVLWYIIIDGNGNGDIPEENGSIVIKEPVSSEAGRQAQVLYDQGYALYTTGNQPKGIPFIERALELDPKHFDALKTLASYYSWGNDSEKAMEHIARARAVARERGKFDDMLRCDAIEAVVEHNWKKALSRYEELYKEDPEDARALVVSGYLLSKYLGRYEEALEKFELYLKMDPDNEYGMHGVTYNYTGTALLNTGRFEEAMESYENYRRLLPDAPDPITSIGGAYLFAGRYQEAYDTYSSLLQLDDPPFTAFEGLGKVCMEMGRLREAHGFFNRYLGKASFHGQTVNGHYHLARIYCIQHETAEFDSAMDKINALIPGHIPSCWLRGIRYVSVDSDPDKARAELIRLTNLMEEPDAHSEISKREHLRGLILLAEKRNTSALQALKLASENSPRDFYLYRREYADALLRTGKTEEALRECAELSRLNPNDPLLLMIMCRAHYRKGDSESAKEYYDRTLNVLASADEDYRPLVDFKAEFNKLAGTAL
jgi:serine/threonine protein kinase/regulator of sirC expression with transglutaminase-like and TPR domain